MVMHRISVLAIMIFLFATIAASDLPRVRSLAETISRHEKLKNGLWSVYAVEAATGNILLDINSQISLVPASNMKLITSAAALDLLGSGMQSHTCLEYDGRIEGSGRLAGNLYLRGEGDPTLGSPEMAGVLSLDSLFQVWVDAVHQAGIKEIVGDCIADISYFDDRYLPDDWTWSDMGNYYGPVASSLCINENSYKLYFKSPAKKFVTAEVLYCDPEIPGLTFKNFMLTGTVRGGSQAFIYGAPEQNVRFLHGYIPSGRSGFYIEGSIPDPALYTIKRLRRELVAYGIAVRGRGLKQRYWQETPRTNLATIASPALEKIVYRLNKKSNNLYAEQLLKILAKRQKGVGSLKEGIKTVEEWMDAKGISTQGLFIQDGSGLARSNGCTAYIFATLLRAMQNSNAFMSFLRSLPVAGDAEDEGSMKSLCAGTIAAGKVHLKSGLMSRVRSHSGYVYTVGGNLVCFSMIANNFTGSYRSIDALHEQLIVQLAALP
jgi:D-alanyl-D-alanine carboxypeptidase/D-alanyl-D-alanine-endopeptidase (penicillin-binding protein 4)